MTTKFLTVCLQKRLTKVKITRKKDLTTSHTDETNSNVHSIENSCKVRAKIEQTISMDENSLRGVALLLNFKPLETTESGNFVLKTESQRTKRDKSTRSWTWANLDWEGSLTQMNQGRPALLIRQKVRNITSTYRLLNTMKIRQTTRKLK